MSFVHSKSTVITIATKDISLYTTTSQNTRSANLHGVTGYGLDDEVNQGGLKKGTFTCEGTYDNTLTVGPRAVMRGQEGNTLAIVRKPEGTGVGKPQEAFNAVLEEYAETNAVTDMVKWAAKFTRTGPITDTVQ